MLDKTLATCGGSLHVAGIGNDIEEERHHDCTSLGRGLEVGSFNGGQKPPEEGLMEAPAILQLLLQEGPGGFDPLPEGNTEVVFLGGGIGHRLVEVGSQDEVSNHQGGSDLEDANQIAMMNVAEDGAGLEGHRSLIERKRRRRVVMKTRS